MERARRFAVLVFALALITVATTVLPQIAQAASKRESKSQVLSRRDEGGLAEALGLVRKVTVAGDRAVITYRAAGDKRPRSLVVDYSEVGSALLYADDGPPLFWMMLALVGVGLAARLMRLSRIQEAKIPELARRRLPPSDR